ncbi:MAG: 3-hydroxyacyl-CoA dehydrogenase NAD-binding domain-containing protein [Gammaproteobacteria bacterium]
MSSQLKHWRREIDQQAICWLTLDRAGATANTLSSEVLAELGNQLDEIERLECRGVVIKSGKSSGFILGADVKEFSQIRTANEGTASAARGQALLARIENLNVPTVAAIDGYALGGGLELALACRYRVVVEAFERTLGLPEVQLGIHPGFGGTVRCVQLVGAPRALDLMLTGRSLSPREALAAGLVDRIVMRDALDAEAADMVLKRPAPRRAPWYLRVVSSAPIRPLLAAFLRRQVARRARRDHYPAPYAIIDLWQRYGGHGAAAERAEALSIGQLFATPTCRNLVRVFELRERLRNLAPRGTKVEHVHVVGAGTMGGDIAAWCVVRGLSVTLQDRALQYVEPALTRARELFKKRLRAPGEAGAAAARLRVDLEAASVGSADVVIEAIIENVDAKRALFASLEPKLRPDALIATNTSSIVLENLSGALQSPGRLVGLHFFNPVASLPLVEVIQGRDTTAEAVQKALSFVTRIGKLPLPCRSAPGFVVNRLLTPYMLEALYAHLDGNALETIDSAAKAFGMPVGPIELADRVGLDVALHVAEILSEVLAAKPPDLLREKVAKGELGAKTHRGFYRYDETGKAIKNRSAPKGDAELADRLILPLLNEAVACLHEGVVADADLLDAGIVFGTGFAPFRGGPMRYARERGVAAVVAKLESLAQRFGTRFTPHAGWRAFVGEA